MKTAPLPEENALKITRDRQTDRRTFLQTTAATAAALALPRWTRAAASDLDPIFAEIDKRHDESLKRLQTWIHQPSIAAENRGMNEGCELTMQCCAKPASRKSPKFPPTASPASSPRSMPALPKPSASISCTTSNRSIPPNGPRRPGTPRWLISPASAK